MMGSPDRSRQRRRAPAARGDDRKAFRGREVRADIRRVGRVRRPWRLRPACQRQRLGARPAAGDQRELGRRADLREMALQDHRQAVSAALRGRVRICGARRNRDEISLGRRDQAEWKSDGQLRRLRQPMGRQADGAGRLVRRRIDLVSTTWSATSGSGRRIVGTPVTKARRPMARHGRAAIATAASSAAVPGTAIQTTSARRTAAGSPPSAGATTSASGSPGRLPLKS